MTTPSNLIETFETGAFFAKVSPSAFSDAPAGAREYWAVAFDASNGRVAGKAGHMSSRTVRIRKRSGEYSEVKLGRLIGRSGSKVYYEIRRDRRPQQDLFVVGGPGMTDSEIRLAERFKVQQAEAASKRCLRPTGPDDWDVVVEGQVIGRVQRRTEPGYRQHGSKPREVIRGVVPRKQTALEAEEGREGLEFLLPMSNIKDAARTVFNAHERNERIREHVEEMEAPTCAAHDAINCPLCGNTM